jgi:uncharacterized protein YcbX
MLQISHLYIYPIKSLGGISLTSVQLIDRGLDHDRRWMLVDEQGMFLTQRSFAAMALLKTSLWDGQLIITDQRDNMNPLALDLRPAGKATLKVDIWGDVCDAVHVSLAADQWFSERLNRGVRLVYMPDDSLRKVDTDYAMHEEITSFSDGYPILMIGQASLDDLNSRLKVPVPMDRFRPNIVFTGGTPYQEDEMKHFQISGMDFYGVKPCGRCVVTTIDQNTAVGGKEPLSTLASYRTVGNKVNFGQNILHKGSGVLAVGDELLLR